MDIVSIVGLLLGQFINRQQCAPQPPPAPVCIQAPPVAPEVKPPPPEESAPAKAPEPQTDEEWAYALRGTNIFDALDQIRAEAKAKTTATAKAEARALAQARVRAEAQLQSQAKKVQEAVNELGRNSQTSIP
jgi:type IV secretory pathway VirB10-like protein